MRWYEGKRVFITGGSSGIGKEMALAIAKAGGRVSIAARGQERLNETVALLNELSDTEHHAISVDVSDEDAVRQASEEIIATLGGIDVVINNAGIARPGHTHELPDEVFRQMMDVNYHGTVNVCRAFLPHLRDQGQGHICNVGSTLSFVSVFGYTAYAPSKYAVLAYSEALRQELYAHNITVSVAYPPDTETPQYHYENQFKPEETKIINETGGLMQPDVVARDILAGVARGKINITPGFMNKLIRMASYGLPWLVRWVVTFQLWQYRRSQRNAPQPSESSP